MALLNYIAPGVYLVIEGISIAKKQRTAAVTVNFYKDSSKEILLGTKYYQFDGMYSARRIKGTLSEPPISAEVGDQFLIEGPGIGEWVHIHGDIPVIAVWFPEGWRFWGVANGETIFLMNEQKYWKRVDSEWKVSDIDPYDVEGWDKFFSNSILQSSNHIASAYNLLKTLPECADCIDA